MPISWNTARGSVVDDAISWNYYSQAAEMQRVHGSECPFPGIVYIVTTVTNARNAAHCNDSSNLRAATLNGCARRCVVTTKAYSHELRKRKVVIVTWM